MKLQERMKSVEMGKEELERICFNCNQFFRLLEEQINNHHFSCLLVWKCILNIPDMTLDICYKNRVYFCNSRR